MKEARPVKTRSLLLSALVLSSNVFQAQAFFHPDEGRWISRDPIGEEGGMGLYTFALNAPVDLSDPLGNAPVPLRGNRDLIWDLDMRFRPIGHPDLHGAYGYTPIPKIGDFNSPERIVKVNACCAKVERASASKMVISLAVPTRDAIGTYVTASGYSEIRAHERKRGSAYLDGFEAFYGPVSGAGSAVTKCGVVCRSAGWEEAKAVLLAYVADQRLQAWSQFYSYELRAQAQIGRENRYRGTVISDGRNLFDRFTSHFAYSEPPPFDDSKVTCPASSTPRGRP